MKKYWLILNNLIYKFVLSRVIFLFNSEIMHDQFTNFGQFLGKINFIRVLIYKLINVKNPKLSQTIDGTNFSNPVGLAAGFDYDAKLTQVLPAIGFGFGTFGTITNNPYKGNMPPRLGRLVKSKSLFVNKGFKNNGIGFIINKLKNSNFEIPMGISIGQTNTSKFSQQQALEDILLTFAKVNKSKLDISYYELNISCPNLKSKVNFYDPENLDLLLKNITELNLRKPIYVKMPIDKSDKEVLIMLSTIYKYKINGVIFGNLQKNRNDKSLDKDEVRKFPAGNFSGKATWDRSNELIALAFQNYKYKLTIIGCGGIFNAKDAYIKIKLGASLVQFITGLIFEGPQLAGQINAELVDLLKKDGFKNIKEAIGTKHI